LRNTASSYNNLELDLTTGDRGGRGVYLERALALLCQTEAATIVNNCAAALVLIVRYFIQAKLDRLNRSSSHRAQPEAIISRGELVQIGGGFRIGEILEASGAKLREVGATNKTTLGDYARAIGKQTALILKVHRSNFFMSGFVESPATAEISALARKKRVPFVEDLGSGAMSATEQTCGCTLPRSIVPSIRLDSPPEDSSVQDFASALRCSVPPVIGYIGDGRFKLDLRTIFSHQDDLVVDAIRTACTEPHHEGH